MEAATYSFDMRQEGADVVFTYTPAKHSWGAGLGFALPIVALSLFGSCQLLSNGSSSEFPFVALAVLTGIASLILYAGVLFVMNSFRRPGTFTLMPNGIRVGDRTFERAHISSIYIDPPGEGRRNAIHAPTTSITRVTMHDTRSVHGAVSSVTSNAAAALGQASDQLRSMGKQYKQQSEWAIGFMYGEKDVRLAKGLRENTASVLFDRVNTTFEQLRA